MVVLDSLRPLLLLPPALPRLLPSFLSMYSDELDSVTGNLRDSAKGSNDGYDVAFPLTLLGLILRLGTVLLGLPVRFPLGVYQLRVVLPTLSLMVVKRLALSRWSLMVLGFTGLAGLGWEKITTKQKKPCTPREYGFF